MQKDLNPGDIVHIISVEKARAHRVYLIANRDYEVESSSNGKVRLRKHTGERIDKEHPAAAFKVVRRA